MDSRREESESEYPDSELPSHSRSGEEYSPPQTKSSCSNEDVNVLDMSSDEDTDSKEDEDQQAGKCKTKKHKTFRTYVFPVVLESREGGRKGKKERERDRREEGREGKREGREGGGNLCAVCIHHVTLKASLKHKHRW